MNGSGLVFLIFGLVGGAFGEEVRGGTVGLGTPGWVFEMHEERNWPEVLAEHGGWVEFRDGKEMGRLERLAEDQAKISRHRARVVERRKAFRERMGAAVPLRVFSLEALSSGQVLIGWEGPQDGYYDVGAYERGGDENGRIFTGEAVHEGVGEASEFSPVQRQLEIPSATIKIDPWDSSGFGCFPRGK